MPGLAIFHPPFTLFDYQALFVAYGYERPVNLLAADMGMGKSVIALASISLLFEDGLIDHVLIECESGKLHEWQDDIKAMTELDVALYSGTIQRRTKMRANLPQVLIGTFDTFRNDLGKKVEEKGTRGRVVKRLRPGPLLDALEGKRVMVVSDEAPARMGASRDSEMYRVHEMAYKALSKTGNFRLLVLSATPMDRDPEGYFNIGRLLQPGLMTVEEFKVQHVAAYDGFGKPVNFKNLAPDTTPPGCISLKERMAPVLLIKRKTDPDVIDLFPKMPEPDFTFVRLGDKHQDFYESVASAFEDENHMKQRSVFGSLRQIAGHPMSLLRSDSEVASTIVNIIGEKGLEALGSAKLDALVNRLKIICNVQGSQAVVFTFYGQSILPIIHNRLVDEGLRVTINHGGMSQDERAVSQNNFRAGHASIFLSSDAGARGINLPEAQYVEEYEAALTHSVFVQRINRIHRVNSEHSVVFAHTFVAKDTVEDGIVNLGLRRHGWNDELLGDAEDGSIFLTAEMRRTLMRIKRNAS